MNLGITKTWGNYWNLVILTFQRQIPYFRKSCVFIIILIVENNNNYKTRLGKTCYIFSILFRILYSPQITTLWHETRCVTFFAFFTSDSSEDVIDPSGVTELETPTGCWEISQWRAWPENYEENWKLEGTVPRMSCWNEEKKSCSDRNGHCNVRGW